MFQKVIILLAVSLLSKHVSAQSDFDIAKKFMSSKGVTLVDKASTRGNTEPYSVFNGEDGNGAIVINGAVVGYSIDNTIGEIPEPLKDILETYSLCKASTRGGIIQQNLPQEMLIPSSHLSRPNGDKVVHIMLCVQ